METSVNYADVFRSNLPFLCENTIGISNLCSELLQRRIITYIECEEVVSAPTIYESCQKLYLLLMKGKMDENLYKSLLSALNQTGNEQITQKLSLENSKSEIAASLTDSTKNTASIDIDTVQMNGDGNVVIFNLGNGNENRESHCSEFVMFNVEDPVYSFVGRENILDILHEKIQNTSKMNLSKYPTIHSQIHVISGMAGVGKTQLVRKYILLHKQEYEHTIWINAENCSTAKFFFSTLADKELRIQLKDIYNKEKDFDYLLKEIYNIIFKKKCLIVFDSAKSFESNKYIDGIKYFLPRSLSPSLISPTILVTSRNKEWPTELLYTSLLSKEESVEFVLEQLKLDSSLEHNRELAISIANLLGGLPKALQTVVDFMKVEMRKSLFLGETFKILEFPKYYVQNLSKILNFRCNETDLPMKLMWESTFKTIKKESREAINFLHFFAFLDSQNIPTFLVLSLFNDTLQDNIIDALFILMKYSVIQLSNASISIHCMVQSVVQEILRDAELIDKVIVELSKLFKPVLSSWSKEDVLYPYVLQNATQVITNATLENVKSIEVTELTKLIAGMSGSDKYDIFQ